jgi:hypothetical protein
MKFPKPPPTGRAPRTPTGPIFARVTDTLKPHYRKEFEAGRMLKIWYIAHTGRWKASIGLLGVVSADTFEELIEILTGP